MYDSNKAVEIEALKVNKLYDFRKHQSPEDCGMKLMKYLDIHSIKTIDPVGHNWPFDYSFLKVFLGNYFCFGRHVRDSKALAQGFIDAGLYEGGTNLQTLCNNFEVKTKELHNSLNDCFATIAVWNEMISRLINPKNK